MATKYIHRCPNQSYAITLAMCHARQSKNMPKCSNCRDKPPGAETCQAQKVMMG